MNNKTMNIKKILERVPKGTKLYSLVQGECILKRVYDFTCTYPIITEDNKGDLMNYTSRGLYHTDRGECILFPSKNCKDWNLFLVQGDLYKTDKGELFVVGETGNIIDGIKVSLYEPNLDIIIDYTLQNPNIVKHMTPIKGENVRRLLTKYGLKINEVNLNKK